MAERTDAHDRVTPTVDLASLALLQVPCLMVSLDELRHLPLSPRTAFLVSLIDGHCSVETIMDVAGLPKSEVAEAIALLVGLGAVALRDPVR